MHKSPTPPFPDVGWLKPDLNGLVSGGGSTQPRVVGMLKGSHVGLQARSSGDKPTTEDREDVPFLIGCQRMPFGDQVPFLKAATAAGSGPVLSDEDRVVPQWGLLAVIRRIGGGGDSLLMNFSPCDITALPTPCGLQVFPFSGTKRRPTAKVRAVQPLEQFIQIAVHPSSPLFGCVVPAF